MFKGLIRQNFLHERSLSDPILESNRVGFGKGLITIGKENSTIVGLCADLTESVGMTEFASCYPDRFFQMGVAEQNMAGVAAGLALSGKIPYMASYAAFSPGRNFDQIRVSIAYSNANVKIIGSHGGLSVGPDGATHQMLEDLAMMRALPNMAVVIPTDSSQAEKAIVAAANRPGPVYIRLSREKFPQITSSKTPFQLGKADVYCLGKDITIIATGSLVYEALRAVKILEEHKIYAEVINCHTIKPLDGDTILRSVAKTNTVITAEEAQANGGLGSAVSELLSQKYPTPVERIGVMDRFGESGTAQELLTAYGLTAEAIVATAHRMVARKKQ